MGWSPCGNARFRNCSHPPESIRQSALKYFAISRALLKECLCLFLEQPILFQQLGLTSRNEISSLDSVIPRFSFDAEIVSKGTRSRY